MEASRLGDDPQEPEQPRLNEADPNGTPPPEVPTEGERPNDAAEPQPLAHNGKEFQDDPDRRERVLRRVQQDLSKKPRPPRSN